MTEKAVAPHSSTFAWKIPWMEEPGRLQSMGSLESDTTEWVHFHFSLSCIGGGNGHPLQCFCLENPRDGEAWWAAIYGVTQSRTWLKRLSTSTSTSHLLDIIWISFISYFYFLLGISYKSYIAHEILFSTPILEKKKMILCAGLVCFKYTFHFSKYTSIPCGFTTSEE